jgi:seryl-tRNA(Sec) selenium transferase
MRKPTLSELRAYANEIGFPRFDPQHFLDYYDANGWRVGKVSMRDWKAAVRLWKKNQQERMRQPQAMPMSQRNEKINNLNRRKAFLLRQPQTPSVQRELEQIRIQLAML